MNILFLTQILPYPPDAGPRVKTWHLLRYLAARGHQVHLASFVRPEERVHLPVLEALCAGVHPVPMRRSRLADLGYWLKSNLSGRPFLIERDDHRSMQRTIDGLLHAHPIDLIHADQLSMTVFAAADRRPPNGRENTPAAGTVPRLFDAHNAVWTILERMRGGASRHLRPVLGLEARRVRRYEGRIVAGFECTTAVTEQDRQALIEAASFSGAAADPPIEVIPISVDTGALQPVRRRPGSKEVLALGSLHYPPNADGIRWFARHVFPLILAAMPQARLTIVGKGPPADLRKMAARPERRLRVTGYVPDLEPYLQQAALVVVPVRAGGGMRVRILEAFARALPVVTTTIGLEGIEAETERHVLVADTPADFARAVLRVMTEPALSERLARQGRRLAEQRYDCQVVLPQIEAVYARLGTAAGRHSG